MYGSSGNDHLEDGDGSDYLHGGDGDDVLTVEGDDDTDVLVGGDGNDTFRFLLSSDETIAQDVIKGFDVREDKIVLGGAANDFELSHVKSNHAVVTVKSADAALATIDVWGDFGSSEEMPMIYIEGAAPTNTGLIV